jgi:hypothetical protein
MDTLADGRVHLDDGLGVAQFHSEPKVLRGVHHAGPDTGGEAV